MSSESTKFAGFGIFRDPEAMHTLLDEEVPFSNKAGNGTILSSRLHIVGRDSLPTSPLEYLGGQSIHDLLVSGGWERSYALSANNWSPAYTVSATTYDINPEHLELLKGWEFVPDWHELMVVRLGNGEEALTISTRDPIKLPVANGEDYDPYLAGKDATLSAIRRHRELESK